MIGSLRTACARLCLDAIPCEVAIFKRKRLRINVSTYYDLHFFRGIDMIPPFNWLGLEFMFEAESRPESQIKQQLAKELGLRPRQVSIWFQNRRARLKIKQVEKEYNKLKASHDALACSFESLKRENQSLLIQLQRLKNKHAMQQERRNCRLDKTEKSSDQRIESSDINSESKEQPSHLLVGESHREYVLPSNHDSGNIQSTKEGTEFLNLYEYKDGFLESSDWNSLDPSRLLDESNRSSQWWEFLP